MAEALFNVNKTKPSITDPLPEIYQNDEEQNLMKILTWPKTACKNGDIVSLVKSGHWRNIYNFF